jgi:nitroimidazol reductase NimA-like FMN-containing flavoprotein (pyridoxamine 5'-phosphate oxidase superfamily)
MIKVINAQPGIAVPLTEKDTKSFLTGNNNLLIHIGTVDAKGEPNVIPTAYYFDENANKIYIPTQKSSKKVENLRKKNIVSFCVDDPNPPYKGVRGKGKVKIHEDINHNRHIAEKLLMRLLGTLEHPTARWLLDEIEKGTEVILEITPSYYSTWDYGKSNLV